MNTNLRDFQSFLDDTASDIAQVLPDINDWSDGMMYLLKAIEFKAMEMELDQQREFENTLRYVIADLNSRLVRVVGNDASIAGEDL
jgi:hypothetical protein